MTTNMKRLLTIALLLVGLTASAQEGKWITGMNEADELKGQEGGPFYLYEQKGMGCFVVWAWDDWEFKVCTDKGTFDVWYYKSNGVRFMYLTMGLYNNENRLVESIKLQLAADASGRSAWINKKGVYIPSTRKCLRKMIGALKSGDGYVRIVCTRRGAPEFDLKVPPYKEPVREDNVEP